MQSQKTVEKLTNLSDIKELNRLISDYGIAQNIYGLTNGQGSYFATYKTVDRIRTAIIARGFAPSKRYNAGKMGQSPSRQSDASEAINNPNDSILQMAQVERTDEINLETLYNKDGGFDYEQVKNVAARIRSGEYQIERLDSGGEQGRIRGGQRNVEASLILGADEATGGAASAAGGSRMDSHSNTVRRQERLLDSALQMAQVEGLDKDWQFNENESNLFDEKGNINYAELKSISDGIERGNIAITRLNEAEKRGRIEGGRRNVEASILLGTSEKTSKRTETQSRFVGWEEHKQAVREQEHILGFASKVEFSKDF